MPAPRECPSISGHYTRALPATLSRVLFLSEGCFETMPLLKAYHTSIFRSVVLSVVMAVEGVLSGALSHYMWRLDSSARWYNIVVLLPIAPALFVVLHSYMRAPRPLYHALMTALLVTTVHASTFLMLWQGALIRDLWMWWGLCAASGAPFGVATEWAHISIVRWRRQRCLRGFPVTVVESKEP